MPFSQGVLAQATALRSGENEPWKRRGAVKPGKCERAGFTWEPGTALGAACFQSLDKSVPGGEGRGVARTLLEYHPALLARGTRGLGATNTASGN